MFSEAFQMREMVDRCAVHDECNLRQSTKVCSSLWMLIGLDYCSGLIRAGWRCPVSQKCRDNASSKLIKPSRNSYQHFFSSPSIGFDSLFPPKFKFKNYFLLFCFASLPVLPPALRQVSNSTSFFPSKVGRLRSSGSQKDCLKPSRTRGRDLI